MYINNDVTPVEFSDMLSLHPTFLSICQTCIDFTGSRVWSMLNALDHPTPGIQDNSPQKFTNKFFTSHSFPVKSFMKVIYPAAD